MKEITVQELKKLMDDGANFQLIDVRSQTEYDIANIGGELIPLAELSLKINDIARDKKVIIHCQAGKRSAKVITYLEQNYDFKNLYNLKGGLLAWRDHIGPLRTKY